MSNFEEKKTDQKEQLMGDDALNKIRELLKHFRSAMLTTVTADGTISTRPMGVQGDADKFEGTLWFFADDRSPKAKLIRSGAHAALVLQNDADKVDYWESPGGMLQVLGAFTKAVATGEPAAGGNAGTANLP